LVGFSAGGLHVLGTSMRVQKEVECVVAFAFAPDLAAQRTHLRGINPRMDELLMAFARPRFARALARTCGPCPASWPSRISDLDAALLPARRKPTVEELDAAASALPVLASTRTRTLCLYALDDPVVEPGAFERAAAAARDNVSVIVAATATGGHHGWADGGPDGGWGNRVAAEFIDAVLRGQATTQP
jgi:pimeloyl-ACP methyl ester carboxylesterase